MVLNYYELVSYIHMCQWNELNRRTGNYHIFLPSMQQHLDILKGLQESYDQPIQSKRKRQ